MCPTYCPKCGHDEHPLVRCDREIYELTWGGLRLVVCPCWYEPSGGCFS